MKTRRAISQSNLFQQCNRGMTLVELSVVIIVLLAFIGMLFIGTRAWKRGSDRAQCIMNIRQVQLAVRGYSNSNNLEVGDYMTLLGPAERPGKAIIGAGNYLERMPGCPGMGLYTIHGNRVPSIGTLYLTCSLQGVARHVPDAFATW